MTTQHSYEVWWMWLDMALSEIGEKQKWVSNKKTNQRPRTLHWMKKKKKSKMTVLCFQWSEILLLKTCLLESPIWEFSKLENLQKDSIRSLSEYGWAPCACYSCMLLQSHTATDYHPLRRTSKERVQGGRSYTLCSAHDTWMRAPNSRDTFGSWFIGIPLLSINRTWY